MLTSLTLSLSLTLLFEVGFALLRTIRGTKELLLITLTNILTNPSVVFIHYVTVLYLPMAAPYVLLFLEISAILVEWRCYYHYSEQIHRPFLFSLMANLISFSLGSLVNLLLF